MVMQKKMIKSWTCKEERDLDFIAKDFLKPFPVSLRKKAYENITAYISSHPVRMHDAKAASG